MVGFFIWICQACEVYGADPLFLAFTLLPVMADFVDYTNVTELEKFTSKLGVLMKEIVESDCSESKIVKITRVFN